jgi:hypothetical protein
VTVLTPIPEAPPKPADKPVELDETGKVLMRAAEIVRERGWCQLDYEDDQGRVCAAGALYAASGDEWPYVAMGRRRLAASLGRAVETWNDVPGRTKEEVIEALERAAYQC